MAERRVDTGVRGTAAFSDERSPEVWIETIRRLKREGRADEAERELKEFRRRHPDYRLPDDLRQP
jgi:hypothetical protein